MMLSDSDVASSLDVDTSIKSDPFKPRAQRAIMDSVTVVLAVQIQTTGKQLLRKTQTLVWEVEKQLSEGTIRHQVR